MHYYCVFFFILFFVRFYLLFSFLIIFNSAIVDICVCDIAYVR